MLAPATCGAQPQPFEGRGELNTAVELVVRERRWQKLLLDATSLLQSNKVGESVELLQLCFSSPDDAFVLRPEWNLPSARGIAGKILRDGGEPVWKAYEAQFGIDAKRALEEQEANGPPGAYYSVIRRFENTQAGATALDRLANWQLGRGDYDAAINCWELLLANPIHASRVTVVQRLKLFFAATRMGRADIAQRESEFLNKTRIELGGQSLTASEWRTKFAKLPASNPLANIEWRLFGGATERTRVSQGSAPFLLRPTATVSMFDPGNRSATSSDDQATIADGRAQFERDLEASFGTGAVTGFAGTPIVIDNLILWRDAFGVRAMDRQKRQTVWAHATASRLHSLLVYNSESEMRARSAQSTYRQSSVVEQLTGDGQHVYFVDPNHIPDRPQTLIFNQADDAPRNDSKPVVPAWNSIVALQIKGPSAGNEIAWRIGGHPTEDRDAPLSGHFFLGPPLPVGGLLYSIAEFERQIWLIAVHPDSGRIEWRQALSLTPHLTRERDSLLPPDKLRLATACLLAGSQGVIVCPLSSGLLVGVNQITGQILWVHDYRARRKPVAGNFQFGQSAYHTLEQFSDGDFPSPPVIHQDRLFFLAAGENPTSDQIICLDLQTGKVLWQVDSSEFKYLASADREIVVAVGSTEVCGLSADKGAVVWSKRVPRISGVGALLAGVYLLPVADGRVLNIDLRDGSEIGFSMQSPGIRPGNLVVSGRDVLSLNGLDLQVFSQSADLLASLEAKPKEQRNSYQFWNELGELQFRMGQLGAAKTSLLKAMSLAEPPTQVSIRALMRELLWQELLQQADQRPKILAEYAEYCDLPEHTAQYLLLKAEEEVRRGNLQAARQTSQELVRTDFESPLRLLADPERHLTVAVWVNDLARRSAEASPAINDLLPTNAAIDGLMQRRDRRALQQFIDQFPDAARSGEVRLSLAKLLVQDGRSQAAELLVWQDHLGNDANALAACRFLLELCDAAGLFEESGFLLHQIGTRLGSVQDSTGISGREIYASYRRDGLAWSAAQRFVAPDWKVDNVRIEEEHDINLQLRNTFNPSPRYLYFPNSSQQLFIRGQMPVNVLQQIDNETGTIVASINLPSKGTQGSFPYFDARNRVGHYLPIGGSENCYGISMLERSLVWHRDSTTEMRLKNNLVRVGPTTSRVSVFRTRDRLFGLDPANGQLLWERGDLEETGRSIPNALTSIPGDAEAIVLLESESKNYRVFKTSDGSFLRQGKLANCFYIFQQYGRNLLFATDQTMRNIQLWDPLTDQVLFEASQMASNVGLNDRDPDFTVADTFGKVRIIDGMTGKSKVEFNLNPLNFQPPQQPPMLRSFTDGTRYYVNVHRQLMAMNNTIYPSDAVFPTLQIAGELHAIDPVTSKVLWSRTKVSPQSLVHLSHYRLPFLVTLSRWRGYNRSSPQTSSQTSLRIDVIDGETGRTMASKNNAFNDRLLLSDYDREAGRIRFRGAVTQIHLDFGRKINPVDPGDKELVKQQ